MSGNAAFLGPFQNGARPHFQVAGGLVGGEPFDLHVRYSIFSPMFLVLGIPKNLNEMPVFAFRSPLADHQNCGCGLRQPVAA